MVSIKALLLSAAIFLFPCAVFAGSEADDLKRDLAAIQSQMNEERALYQAAKASMERSEVVAKYLFPVLQAREQELLSRIKKAEADEADRGPDKTKTGMK